MEILTIISLYLCIILGILCMCVLIGVMLCWAIEKFCLTLGLTGQIIDWIWNNQEYVRSTWWYRIKKWGRGE